MLNTLKKISIKIALLPLDLCMMEKLDNSLK